MLLLAGYLSGVRGAGAGLRNGLTAWGLLFVASVLTVVPGLTAITTNLGAGLGRGRTRSPGAWGSRAVRRRGKRRWTAFWSLLIGAAVAALGGVLGGAVKREVRIADTNVWGGHNAYPVELVTFVATDRVTGTHVVSAGVREDGPRRR